MQPFPSNGAKDGIEDPAVSTLGCLFEGLRDGRQAGDDAQYAGQLHIIKAIALVVHTTKHAAHLVLAAGKLLILTPFLPCRSSSKSVKSTLSDACLQCSVMKFYYLPFAWSTDISSFLNSTRQAPGSRLHHLPEEERLAPANRGIFWIRGTY